MSALSQTVNNGDELEKLLRFLKEDCLKGGDAIKDNNDTCGKMWDGIMCWPPSPAGIHSLSCPFYIIGFNRNINATKHCFQNLTWHNWTDFSQCSNNETHPTVFVPWQNNGTLYWDPYIPLIKFLSYCGYGTSLITLMIAFLILASFKRLRCPRNMLHLHLFTSFIMRAFITFLKSGLFEQGVGPGADFAVSNGTRYFHQEEQGNWGCKVMTLLWQYFIVANYSWVLMEGLYIHNLIMWALSADGSSILIFIILGWGLPMIFVSAWGTARAFLDDNLCWTTHEKKEIHYIIFVPIIMSLLINFGLFINILRLLMKKVKSTYKEEAERYWKLAKSTLVLFALFGVPYVIIFGLYFGDGAFHVVWLFCDQLFASFQGFFISLLYCFLNREVLEELQRKLREFHAVPGRLTENNLPITSFASWSSSHSMAKRTSGIFSCFRLSHQCFTCGQRPESRTSKRTETVDCIICETCPGTHEGKGAHFSEEHCRHGEEQEEPGVEMKLMGMTSIT